MSRALAALGFNVGLSGVGLEGNRTGQEGGWSMADGWLTCIPVLLNGLPLSCEERPVWLRSFIRGCRGCESGGTATSGSLHARKNARSAIAGQGRATGCSPRVARFGAICTAATTTMARGSQAGRVGLSDRMPKRKARCYRQVHQRPRLLVSGVAVACYHSFWGWRAAHLWSGRHNLQGRVPKIRRRRILIPDRLMGPAGCGGGPTRATPVGRCDSREEPW